VRSWSFLLLVLAVGLTWAASGLTGRALSTYGYFFDTEQDTGNTITAGVLQPPTKLCTNGNTCTSTSSTVHLEWTPSVSAEEGQRVFRATGACPGGGALPGGATQRGADLAASATSFDDSASASTTYCYYIQAFLKNWTANSAPSQVTTPSAAVPKTTTLFPNADKASDAWKRRETNENCAATGTNCWSEIDEDIDTPVDTDYIKRSNVPSSDGGSSVSFDVTNAPADFVQLTQITVRFRASRSADQAVTLTVKVKKADGTELGASSVTLGTAITSYSFNITTGLSGLSAADVDGIFVEITASRSVGGTAPDAFVYTVNLDINYLGTP
jgi:hypothetical protein